MILKVIYHAELSLANSLIFGAPILKPKYELFAFKQYIHAIATRSKHHIFNKIMLV